MRYDSIEKVVSYKYILSANESGGGRQSTLTDVFYVDHSPGTYPELSFPAKARSNGGRDFLAAPCYRWASIRTFVYHDKCAGPVDFNAIRLCIPQPPHSE